MKKDGKGFSVALLSALALGAVGLGVVVAFLAGYFLGHFTGHTKTTTVSALASAPETSAPETNTTESSETSTSETSTTETGSEEEPARKEKGKGKGKKQGNEKGEAKKGGVGGEPAGANLAAGKTVFETNCGSCHTLAEAGTSGTVGPNLDELKPEKALVETQVTNGGGVMPAFGGTLSPGEIEAVAEYVSTVAGTGS